MVLLKVAKVRGLIGEHESLGMYIGVILSCPLGFFLSASCQPEVRCCVLQLPQCPAQV